MIKLVTIPIFDYEFYLYLPHVKTGRIPVKLKKAIEELDEHYKAVRGGQMDGAVYRGDCKTPPILSVASDKDGNINWNTLSHEVCHLAFFMCGDKGIVVREGGDNETFCYLVSYILEQLFIILTRNLGE